MFLMRSTLAIPLLLTAMAFEVRADIIHVPADQPTIQAGIDAAADGDTVLVAPGTYTGNGNRDIRLLGKAITLKSEAGPEQTIIDAEGSPGNVHRGFNLIDGETHDSVIDGFTITGGYLMGDTGGIGPSGGGGGAGMFLRNSSPVVRNCIIRDNYSATISVPFLRDGRGGGVYVNEISNARLVNCTIANNVSEKRGGGFMSTTMDASVDFTGCLITRNTCFWPYLGAGLYYVGSGRIQNTTVAFNSTRGFASGLYMIGNVSIRNSVFWGNESSEGAQIVADEIPAVGLESTLFVSHSIIQKNPFDILVDKSPTIRLDASVSNDDPMFASSEQNDFRPLAASPCIDAGTQCDDNTPLIDLDGAKRIQNCRIEIGAYESPYFTDCDDNRSPDACDATDRLVDDCNNNLSPDECDLETLCVTLFETPC